MLPTHITLFISTYFDDILKQWIIMFFAQK